MSLPNAKLSCKQCQARKTRCDKTVPCNACQRAGLECAAVLRQRLPRGRSGNARGKESALRNRINRLEAVVSQMQRAAVGQGRGDESVDPVIPTDELASSDDAASPVSHGLAQFVAPTFWAELSDAVTGLQDVLEESDEEDYDGIDHPLPSGSNTHTGAGRGNSTALLFGVNAFSHGPQTLHRPPPETRSFLFAVYRERVDVIFKVLHWPSVQALFGLEARYSPVLSSDDRALEFAIYFVALCTLSGDEIEERDTLMEQYRVAAELSLVRAGLLSSLNLVVLQAFVLYLLGIRTCRDRADSWTLIACAIRIANAQGIDSEQRSRRNPLLERDLQCRVWCGIGLLDLQFAFDRGTRPLLAADDFPTLPLNIDDMELSSASTVPVQHTNAPRFTEMSFCLVNYRAMICQRRLTTPAASVTIGHPHSAWDRNLETLDKYESQIKSLTQAIGNLPTTELQKFTIVGAQVNLKAMRLLLRRPMHKSVDGSPPLEDDFDVMKAATDVLEQCLNKQTKSEFSKWGWYTWVPWFALAVVLAELCSHPGGTEADHVWAVAKESYHAFAQSVADGTSGLLWKPIVRLMRKVGALRSSKAVESFAEPQEAVTMDDTYWMELDLLLDGRIGIVDGVETQQAIPSSVPASSTDRPPSIAEAVTCENISSLQGPQHVVTGALYQEGDAMSWFNWELFIDEVNGQSPT